MKKIFVLCAFSCLLLSGCGKKEINALKAENQKLQDTISQLQQEIKVLKETDQYYYQQGIELLSQNKYQEAQEQFTRLMDNFPTSPLIAQAQEKIKEIEKNRAEATKQLKALPAKLAKEPDALAAEKLLNELSEKYNYPDVLEAVNTYKAQLQEQINKEKEMESALKELGIEISRIRTYWTLDKNVMGGQALVIPYIRFYLKNVGKEPITRLAVSASFELTSKKEVLGEGSSYVISSSEAPLKPGYSKEIFFGSSTGYVSNGYDALYFPYPPTHAELFMEINGQDKRLIKEINIRREFQY